ncbi:MAG TPA: CHAT domain-containing protein, partial [Candidatus Krumholzibacteria bacterium]|nr:CHAT domain-containing protein [Candidatus Krumholzibacteria bacterium]
HELQSRLDEHTAYIGWLDAKFADDMLTSTAPFLNARWMYMIRRSEPIQWRPIYEVRTRSQDAAVRNDSRQFYAVIGRAANWRGRVDDDPELKRLALHVFHAEFGPGAFELKGIDKLVAEFACYDEWMQSDGLVDDSGHYLSERYAVSYSPSASVYDVLVNSLHHQHASAPEVLAIGDPVYSHTSAPATDSRIDEVTLRSAINHDAGALDRLPALPYSGVEIDSVQALFHDCRVLRGDDASEVTVDKIVTRPSASKFDIVHIATHALVDRQPERCAIALSRDGTDGSVSNDGLIDASEIRMGWKLDAELVTLSACQTAGVGFHRGEPSGFAQALFQAGARCVLLTFWKVDDRATSLLMSRFYENVAAYSRHGETISYSEALEGAKNWLRTYQDAKGNRPFAHPVYWSGFVLIGDAN